MPRYSHLSLEEREQIATLRAEGLSLRAIGKRLGRNASTLSRELERNALPSGGYRPVHAEGGYLLRRQRQAILERDPKLQSFVHQRLLDGWTPEQISGWLKRGEERGLRTLGTETIYSFIYRPRQREEKLWKLLPRGRAKRQRRHAHKPRGGIPDRASVHDRPGEVDSREQAGHWEGDLMICKRTRPLLVLVERKTHMTLMARLTGKAHRQDRRRDRLDPDGRLPAHGSRAPRLDHLRPRTLGSRGLGVHPPCPAALGLLHGDVVL